MSTGERVALYVILAVLVVYLLKAWSTEQTLKAGTNQYGLSVDSAGDAALTLAGVF